MQRPKILTPEEEKTLARRGASAGCAQAPGSAPVVNEANEFRLLAHELIRRLYVSGERNHLQLLKDHCDCAIEKINIKTKAQNKEVSERRAAGLPNANPNANPPFAGPTGYAD